MKLYAKNLLSYKEDQTQIDFVKDSIKQQKEELDKRLKQLQHAIQKDDRKRILALQYRIDRLKMFIEKNMTWLDNLHNKYDGLNLEQWKRLLTEYKIDLEKNNKIFEKLKTYNKEEDFNKMQNIERRIESLKKVIEKCYTAIDYLEDI